MEILNEGKRISEKMTPTIGFKKMKYWENYEDGKFQRVGELKDLIYKFKDFYVGKKIEFPDYSAPKIMGEFQELIAPIKFCPYPNQYKSWKAKWDKEIKEKREFDKKELMVKRAVQEAVKTRDEENGMIIIPAENALEDGTKTLAGELVNDAMKMLKDDQEFEDIYTSEELIKRRTYVLNVMSHVTKMVQGKQALQIKANAEKREAAGFLFDLLRKATSGKMTREEINLLKSVSNPPVPEEQSVQ